MPPSDNSPSDSNNPGWGIRESAKESDSAFVEEFLPEAIFAPATPVEDVKPEAPSGWGVRDSAKESSEEKQNENPEPENIPVPTRESGGFVTRPVQPAEPVQSLTPAPEKVSAKPVAGEWKLRDEEPAPSPTGAEPINPTPAPRVTVPTAVPAPQFLNRPLDFTPSDKAPKSSRGISFASPKQLAIAGATVLGAILVFIVLGVVLHSGSAPLVVKGISAPSSLEGLPPLASADSEALKSSLLQALGQKDGDTTPTAQVYGAMNPSFVFLGGVVGPNSAPYSQFMASVAKDSGTAPGIGAPPSATQKFTMSGIQYDCWSVLLKIGAANVCSYTDGNIEGAVIDLESGTIAQTVKIADDARLASEARG